MRPSFSVFTFLLLTLSTPASMLGQGAGAAGGPPPGGPPPGGPPGGRMGPSFDPLVLEGPMDPKQFALVTEATPAQQERYAILHENYLVATKVERENMEYYRKRMQDAMAGGGGRDEMFRSMQGLEGSGKLLEKQLKDFDDALKSVLEKDQFKKYQKARKEQRKKMEDRMPRPGAGPPGF